MRLTQLIVQYIAFRKNLGQDFESDGKRLRTFSRFVGESAVRTLYCDAPQSSWRTGSDNSSHAFQVVMKCRLFDAKAKN
jgi:hypothetical protein